MYTASSSLNLTPAIYHSPPSFGSGEKIDFLGPADNVKQLLKLPFCGTFAKKCLHKWLRRRYNTTTIKCYWRTVFVIHTLTNSMRALKHTQKSQYLSLYIAWGIHSSSKGASTTTRFYMIFRVRSDILAIHLCSLLLKFMQKTVIAQATPPPLIMELLEVIAIACNHTIQVYVRPFVANDNKQVPNSPRNNFIAMRLFKQPHHAASAGQNTKSIAVN